MSRSFWRLAVRSEFSAGHALRNYKGKCESMHGHNFEVEAIVQGKKLTEDTEYLVDFSVLKRLLNRILDDLDHKVLNCAPPFDRINPTSENLSRYIFQRLSPETAVHGVALRCVSVSEKAAQKAVYYEIEDDMI